MLVLDQAQHWRSTEPHKPLRKIRPTAIWVCTACSPQHVVMTPVFLNHLSQLHLILFQLCLSYDPRYMYGAAVGKLHHVDQQAQLLSVEHLF